MTWVLVGIAVVVVAVMAASWVRAGRQAARLEADAQQHDASPAEMEARLRADLNRTHRSGPLGGHHTP